MKYFETQGPDGRIYLHYDRWHQWRAERQAEYPCRYPKHRYDLEIAYPQERLEAIPVERNPHSFFGLTPHSCFYYCDIWSTIFGVHDAHLYTGGSNHRMLVESYNPTPIWGERIALISTSSCFEPLGLNPPNRFAFFRGMYWRVMMAQFLHLPIFFSCPELVQWPPTGRVRAGPDNRRPFDWLTPLLGQTPYKRDHDGHIDWRKYGF